MKTKISNWGNSLAVRLPKVQLNKLKLKEGSVVDILSKDDSLLVKPIRTNKKADTLNDLIVKIRPEQLHDEIDWGNSVDGEVW